MQPSWRRPWSSVLNTSDHRRRADRRPPGHAVVAAICGLVIPACDKPPGVEHAQTATLFTEVVVDTAHGLSGLAADDTDGLWTVAERDRRAYRITLTADLRPSISRGPSPPAPPAAPVGSPPPTTRFRSSIETLTVEGMPPDTDLEAIAVLGNGRFAFGTEGKADGVATVLVAERRAQALVVTQSIDLPERHVGIALRKNHGAEGVCGGGDEIVTAIEEAGEDAGRRWAPVLRIAGGAITRRHRLWLTSPTGKISGLDCRIAADGTVTGWAIERHFEVTRLLRFTLPPIGTGADDVTPVIALDLGATIAGRLNLEGIAALSDGRIVAAIDNQWKTITGPSELLVFQPGAVH
jgi:hypothetical protein